MISFIKQHPKKLLALASLLGLFYLYSQRSAPSLSPQLFHQVLLELSKRSDHLSYTVAEVVRNNAKLMQLDNLEVKKNLIFGEGSQFEAIREQMLKEACEKFGVESKDFIKSLSCFKEQEQALMSEIEEKLDNALMGSPPNSDLPVQAHFQQTHVLRCKKQLIKIFVKGMLFKTLNVKPPTSVNSACQTFLEKQGFLSEKYSSTRLFNSVCKRFDGQGSPFRQESIQFQQKVYAKLREEAQKESELQVILARIDEVQ